MSNTSDQTTQPSKTRLIVGEIGVDTETGIIGKGHSYDNGKTFVVDDTIYGRIYRQQDGDSIWPFLKLKISTIKDPFVVTTVQSGTYDDLITSGYYEISTSSVTGGPSTETGVLKVIDANENIITQTIHTVSDDVWIRNKHNDAWTTWRKITL